MGEITGLLDISFCGIHANWRFTDRPSWRSRKGLTVKGKPVTTKAKSSFRKPKRASEGLVAATSSAPSPAIVNSLAPLAERDEKELTKRKVRACFGFLF